MPVLARMSADPTYGGSYLDEATGLVLTVLTTADPLAFRTAYEGLMPAGGKLKIVRSARNIAAVEARVAEIGATLADYGGHSAHFDPRTVIRYRRGRARHSSLRRSHSS